MAVPHRFVSRFVSGLGPDGVIYFGSGDGYIYAVNPDGAQKWRYSAGGVTDSSPAIGPDGTIYVGMGYDGGSGKLFAFRPDGSKIWQLNLPGGGVVSSPAVDPSGTVYVGACDHKLYAVNPNGTVLFTFETGSSVVSSPALGADSSVVFGSYDGNIYCLRDVTSKDLTPPSTPVVEVASQSLPVGQPLVVSWQSTDAESMVAEYVYCVGTRPGECDVTGWTSAGIETGALIEPTSLEVGTTYYVSVKARNPSQRWSDFGVSPGVTVIAGEAVDRIGLLKLMDDGSVVTLASKVVTAVFDDCVFISEPNRVAGIRCVSSETALKVGDIVNVTGTLSTLNGERVVLNAGYSVVGSGPALRPLGLAGRSARQAVPDLLGLYVTTWGRVTAVGDDYVVIDSGVKLVSARGARGLEVKCASHALNVGDVVCARGVLCREQVNHQPVTVLRATQDGLLTFLSHH